MALKALFLNCTLKKSPEVSNTRAFIDKSITIFKELDVETEVIRVIDYTIKFGNSTDMGSGDQWPAIHNKIKQADIVIIATPVWRGDRGSIAKMVSERMDGLFSCTIR